MHPRSAWEVRPADPHRVGILAARCGCDPLIGQLLLNRGLSDPAEVQAFLTPTLDRLEDPFRLSEMDRAVLRIRRAITAQESMVIFGDSDVDGLTASAILVETLTSLGAKASARVSNRIADGYGFPAGLIPQLVRAGIALVIVVDCGTNQPDEIRQLAEQGIDTIVLDHHVPLERVAEPLALVNPHRDSGVGQELCSAGLAFNMVRALCPGETGRIDHALDLAALGTLADYAPLVGENRILVACGLERIWKTRRPGLQRLCEAVHVTAPTSEQILRRLVPRLNAVGRLGDAGVVCELLTASSTTAIDRLTAKLAEAHVTTKSLHRRILAEAHAQVDRIHFKDHAVMVIGRQGWHPGLMGPIAAQLVEQYARPTIAIALDEHVGVGSGRSPVGVNLLQALQACQGMLLRYGGHPQACGLMIKSRNMEQFRDQINQHVRDSLRRDRLEQTLTIDAEATLEDLTGG
ncbi:MAG: DHH family phosphoesterase, partial [Candidatus Omnitrophica bacterium]|nr:DHH family phosphoesterase [Candidatus Omnitrophota bacterium]